MRAGRERFAEFARIGLPGPLPSAPGEQMDWTRLEVDGRVTALARGLCAGVTADGDAFVVPLRLPHPAERTYDGLLLDSFGVLGVAQGEQTWLTGRGADGRLHLWAAYTDGSMFVTLPSITPLCVSTWAGWPGCTSFACVSGIFSSARRCFGFATLAIVVPAGTCWPSCRSALFRLSS